MCTKCLTVCKLHTIIIRVIIKKLYKNEYIFNYLKQKNITKEDFCLEQKIPLYIFESIISNKNIYNKHFIKIYKLLGKPKDFFDV